MQKSFVALCLLFALSLSAQPKSYYLYVLKLVRKDAAKTGFTDAEKAIISEHAAYHAKLTKDGVEVVAGPTLDDDPIGIVVYSAATAEEAKSIMNADPAVVKGIMTATLHPFAFAFGTAKPTKSE